MKNIFCSLTLLIVSLISCKTDCEIDLLYKKNFNNNIDLIKRTSYDTLLVKDIRLAVVFLSATTGIEAQEFDMENGVFYSKNDLVNNIERWENWYQKNRCTMTMDKADSLMRGYK